MESDFAVRTCPQPVSSFLELLLDRLITVEFAVHNNAKASIFVGDGLISGRQIDNAEPRVAEADAAISCNPMALAVRTTMMEALRCFHQRLRRYPTVLRKNCNDSAHLKSSA